MIRQILNNNGASRRRDAAGAALLLLLTLGLLRVGFESRIFPTAPRRAEGHSISSAPAGFRLSTPEERQTLDVSFTAGPTVPVERIPITLLVFVSDFPAPREGSGPRIPGLRAPPISLS